MVTNILTPLDDTRTGTVRMDQTTNSKEIVENKNESYKLSSGDYSNCLERAQNDEFDFEDGSDNKLKHIIDTERYRNWRICGKPTDNNTDSATTAPFSPLSKGLVIASDAPASDINDDYFTSASHSLKTCNFSGSSNSGSSSPVIPTLNTEYASRTNVATTPRGEGLLELKEQSLMGESLDDEAIKNGINRTVSNNLAGIVISSGPGGHFETFEGIRHNADPACKIYSPSLLHAQNTMISLQGEVAMHFTEQQPQDTAASSIYPIICNAKRRDMVTDIGLIANNSNSVSVHSDGQVYSGNTFEAINPNFNSRLFIASEQEVKTGSSCADINNQEGPAKKSSLVSPVLMTNTTLHANDVIFTDTNNVTSNYYANDRVDVHSNTTQPSSNAAPTTKPNTINNTKISSVTATCITKQSNHDIVYKYANEFVTNFPIAKTIPPTNMRSKLAETNSSINKPKAIFRKSLLKSKIFRGKHSMVREGSIPITKTYNAEKTIIPDTPLPIIPLTLSLVSRASSTQTPAAAADDDGKYIPCGVLANIASMLHFI